MAAVWRAPGNGVGVCTLCSDVNSNRPVQAAITTMAAGERIDRFDTEAGEVLLADRAYPQPDGLARLRKAGGDVLVRLTWNSLRLVEADDAPLDWMGLFEAANAHGVIDRPVRTSDHGRHLAAAHPDPCLRRHQTSSPTNTRAATTKKITGDKPAMV